MSADESARRPFDPIIVGAAMALVALAAGMINASRSFSYDEAITYSFFINEGSPRRALTTQVVFNNHPMFSFVEAVLWRLGFVSEAAQRLWPVGCGAATVGIVSWYTQRRGNVVGGVVAGLVLLLNPMFFELYRSVRGYSMAMLCVIIAGLAVQHSWHDHQRRWLALQAVAMVLAVTTHAYSALFILTFAVATAALGHVRTHHVATWCIAAVVALGIMAPVLDDALRNAEARGNRYAPGFAMFTLRELLGRSIPVVLVIATLVVLGAAGIALRSRRHAIAIGLGVVVPFVAFMYVWQIAQPLDLYSRFFVGLVPFTAVLAGLGASKIPWPAAAVFGLAIAVLLLPAVQTLVEREAGTREAGSLVDQARSMGRSVCGASTEAIWVYTPQIPFVDLDALEECDVFVAGLRLGGEPLELVNNAYPAQLRVDGAITIWGDVATIEALTASP